MDRTGHRPPPLTASTATTSEQVFPVIRHLALAYVRFCFQRDVFQGGEGAFICRMVDDSLRLRTRVKWYTSLIGRKATLGVVLPYLKHHGITTVRTTVLHQVLRFELKTCQSSSLKVFCRASRRAGLWPGRFSTYSLETPRRLAIMRVMAHWPSPRGPSQRHRRRHVDPLPSPARTMLLAHLRRILTFA